MQREKTSQQASVWQQSHIFCCPGNKSGVCIWTCVTEYKGHAEKTINTGRWFFPSSQKIKGKFWLYSQLFYQFRFYSWLSTLFSKFCLGSQHFHFILAMLTFSKSRLYFQHFDFIHILTSFFVQLNSQNFVFFSQNFDFTLNILTLFLIILLNLSFIFILDFQLNSQNCDFFITFRLYSWVKKTISSSLRSFLSLCVVSDTTTCWAWWCHSLRRFYMKWSKIVRAMSQREKSERSIGRIAAIFLLNYVCNKPAGHRNETVPPLPLSVGVNKSFPVFKGVC